MDRSLNRTLLIAFAYKKTGTNNGWHVQKIRWGSWVLRRIRRFKYFGSHFFTELQDVANVDLNDMLWLCRRANCLWKLWNRHILGNTNWRLSTFIFRLSRVEVFISSKFITAYTLIGYSIFPNIIYLNRFHTVSA